MTKRDKWPCYKVVSIATPYYADSWLEREIRQADMGPFWANRGKRDPKYLHSRLYVEEPHWLYTRQDNKSFDNDFDPYFTTRGKKYDNKLLAKLFGGIRKRTYVKEYTQR